MFRFAFATRSRPLLQCRQCGAARAAFTSSTSTDSNTATAASKTEPHAKHRARTRNPVDAAVLQQITRRLGGTSYKRESPPPSFAKLVDEKLEQTRRAGRAPRGSKKLHTETKAVAATANQARASPGRKSAPTTSANSVFVDNIRNSISQLSNTRAKLQPERAPADALTHTSAKFYQQLQQLTMTKKPKKNITKTNQHVTTVKTNASVADKLAVNAQPIDSLTLETRVIDQRSPAESGVPLLASALRAIVKHQGPQRTGTITTDPHYHNIPTIDSIDMDRIRAFTRPSHDVRLIEIAAGNECQYVASSSSSTGLLSHLWMIFLGNTDLDLQLLSKDFHSRRWHPTAGARCPAVAVLKKRIVRNGKLLERSQSLESVLSGQSLSSFYDTGDSDRAVWAIDRAPTPSPSTENVNVLSDYGHVIERLLTMEPEDFNMLLKSSQTDGHSVSANILGSAREASQRDLGFQYMKGNSVMFRSQLDCYDPSLPTSPTHSSVFDLKSRAIAPIRYDIPSYAQYRDYEILHRTGVKHSFEYEYYDLARGVFLKYLLQCRIGCMNGILLAYHNTSKILGFQMVEREEMEAVVCGRRHQQALADRCWSTSIRLLSTIQDYAVRVVSEMQPSLASEQVKVVFASSPIEKHTLSIFIECENGVTNAGTGSSSDSSSTSSAVDELVQSRAVMDKLDLLDVPSLLRIACTHSIAVADEHTHTATSSDRDSHTNHSYRYYLISKLEHSLVQTIGRELPPLAHFVDLAKKKMLLKVNLTIHHTVNNQVTTKPLSVLTAEEMVSLRSHYSIDVSHLPEQPNYNPVLVAKEYVSVLIASRIGMEDAEIPFDSDTEDFIDALEKDIASDSSNDEGKLQQLRAAIDGQSTRRASPKRAYQVSYMSLRQKMSLNAHDRFRKQKLDYEEAGLR